MGKSIGDTLKDVVVGSVGAAATALTGQGTGAALATLIPTVVSTGFNAIRDSDRKKAEDLIKRMIAADESPAEFAEALNSKLATDPDVVAAFRAMTVASIDSVTQAAIEPIALVGRQYLRGMSPTWAARGWLRLLADLSESELGILRAVVQDGARRRSIIDENEKKRRQGQPEGPWANTRSRTRVRLQLHRTNSGEPSLGLWFTYSVGLFHNDPAKRFETDGVERLWQLLNRNHLGVLIPDPQQQHREREPSLPT